MTKVNIIDTLKILLLFKMAFPPSKVEGHLKDNACDSQQYGIQMESARVLAALFTVENVV